MKMKGMVPYLLLWFLWVAALAKGTVGPRKGTSASTSELKSRSVDTRVEFDVEEEQPVGTVVGRVPTKPGFTYRFNDAPVEFTLNGSTGVITTATVLDREALLSPRYDLVILSSQPTYPIEVKIVVVDVNDNSPTFPEAGLDVTFSESSSPGTRIILDTATDRDVGKNAVTTDYRIESGNEDGKFRLVVITNPSGEAPYLHLETASALDREVVASYRLNVSARDGGKVPRAGYLLVRVTVLDANDNPPIFDHSDYVVSLNESVPVGTSVLQVHATDSDADDNSRLAYYVADGESRFDVDQDTGVIRTSDKLRCDRSEPCLGLGASGDVTETSNTRGGSMPSCPKSCVFTVFARDHGSPRQDGRTYVTVNLVDANDHDPVIRFRYFPPTAAFATVDENAPNGSVVAAVSVLDPDDGANGETRVELRAGNERGDFRLERTPTFDLVRVNGALDRERVDRYNLTVVSTDGGSPPRSATAFLLIRVNDVNDHAPVFEKANYTSSVSEAAPKGTFVAALAATDGDTGLNSDVFYAIVSGNEKRWFHIDTETGLVTTAGILDREQQSQMVLKVAARDGGPNPRWAYASLSVDVVDENDEAPKFEGPFSLGSPGMYSVAHSLAEDAPVGTVLMNVRAVDADLGANGSVVYEVEAEDGGPVRTFFVNSSTGVLSTVASLDREVAARHVITVVARDKGSPPKATTATVTLQVEDINDVEPRFYPVRYFTSLHELATPGTSVLKLLAVDPDEGSAGQLHFGLITGGEEAFDIEETTGIIRTTPEFTKRAKVQPQPQFRLVVSVRDGGDRKASQNASVDILISRDGGTSVTDLQQQFAQSHRYQFNIAEDADGKEANIGREVGRVSASGILSETNVRYYISNGDSEMVFKVDEATGAISSAKAVDREKRKEYALTLVARSPSGFAEILVSVTVDDINDNAPKFELPRAVVHVYEDRPVGHVVYMARANDPDEGDGGSVFYNLTSSANGLFIIDATTGAISISRSLDFESTPVYELVVTASDGGNPAMSSRQALSVRVDDVNDHTPAFEHLTVETSLSEATAVNERFYALRARDSDAGDNGKVSYRIFEQEETTTFGVFPDGWLYVRSALDRETQSHFELTVVATDDGTPARSASVLVSIAVLDENDNRPRFSNRTFEFRVAENAAVNAYVGRLVADDADAGRNAELTFSLGGGSAPDSGFSVDPRTGVLKTTVSLDREALLAASGQTFVVLDAVVTDGGLVRGQDDAKLVVHVTDVNDNPPVFVRLPYATAVSEAAPVGTPVLRVSASDADDGANGHVTYALSPVGDDVPLPFVLDTKSGEVRVSAALDREVTAKYAFSVIARDSGRPNPLTATAVVTVDILDENDNAPTITSVEERASVWENATVGTPIAKFQGEDADAGPNGAVTYRITGGNLRETFSLHPETGRMTLARPLDFETKPAFRLNVTATDGGSPSRTATVVFTVIVRDVNDNAPVFPAVAVLRQVQEGLPADTPVATVTARDPDSGRNGAIRYKLVRQEPPGIDGRLDFAVRPVTGVIYTIRELDRESSDTYRLTVVAEDQAVPVSSRKSAEKHVTIIVEDVNDNSPMFVSLDVAVVSAGAEKGSTVITVRATDVDANENGKVTYDMVEDGGGVFSLDRYTGRIYLAQRLDVPKVQYQLEITASDGATPSQKRSSQTKVTILGASNVNISGQGKSPVFARVDYSASVPENETVGLSVVQVKASGRADAEIHYYVTAVLANGVPQPRVFQVDKRSGLVTTAAVLDREIGVANYVVEVTAADVTASVPAIGSAKVFVTLLDKNDSPPVFHNISSVYTVAEDAARGLQIAILAAEDPDSEGTVTYRLETESEDAEGSRFSVDTNTGALRVAAAFDRETRATYRVTVAASDGVQTARASVNVVVADVNDHAPSFKRPVYSFDVLEDAARGAQAGAVAADDPDDNLNAQVTFSVMSDWGDGDDVFSLNPQTGVFTLTSHLDYEQTQHYVFVVVAQDSGQPRLSSTATVYFNVLDLNDNAPVFDPLSYSDEIYENVTVGTSVIVVAATDQDSGMNGNVEYDIVGGDDDGVFAISPNGTIYTVKGLDREERASYSLLILAIDRSFPPQKRLSSTALVSVLIRDVNDHSPEFVTPATAFVSESAPPGTVVLAVKAIDRDEGGNSYVEYSLTSVEDLDGRTLIGAAFALDPVDGLLRVSGRLDRETTPTYNLNVVAKDRGDPPLETRFRLAVHVVDENDNGPAFDPVLYSGVVPENASVGFSVLQVSATDADEGDNGRVRYSIVGGHGHHAFSVAEDTGVLRLAGTLDFEAKSFYVLTVQAEDGGAEPRFDSATVTVTVSDVNDNPPVFVHSPYVVRVLENAPVSSHPAAIAHVTAMDYDAPPNNQVRYFLKDGGRGLFTVDAATGEISVHQPLDRETTPLYELVVIAMDAGSPRLTGTGTVLVHVSDVNDNTPMFEKSKYVLTVPENTQPESVLLTVSATDPDEYDNSLIRYSIAGDSTNDKFAINSTTGEVFLLEALDREQWPEYELVLVATDSSPDAPRNSTAAMIISVSDRNDNPPVFQRESFMVFVPDDITPGHFVFGAMALDKDFGDNGRLRYSLDGKDAGKFVIHDKTGVVKTATALKNGTGTYRFNVRATDEGSPPLSATASVEVQTRPERHDLAFQPGTRSFAVSELVPSGTSVATLSARGAAAGISYRLVGGNMGDAFAVSNSTAVITVATPLDYEISRRYELWVEARDDGSGSVPDGGSRAVVSIEVNVTDANDNSPVFQEDVYVAVVSEEEPPPLAVVTVKAVDLDSGNNGRFAYRFRSGQNGVSAIFAVDPRSGRVTTTSRLDRETLERYVLTLEAVDEGTPTRTGTVTLIVTVADKNDNPPRFTRLFSANVTENAAIGTFVIQVTSSDRDSGPNANATYTFTENPGNRFKIDPVSGNITVAGPIDREAQDEYVLKVAALDGSWRAETPLTIAVQDANDNSPTCERAAYAFRVAEQPRAVAFVGRVSATDADKPGPNAFVSYTLKRPSDLFDIDPASGELFSKKAVRYERDGVAAAAEENAHSLVVIARDHGKPSLSAECAVTVHVIDANNHAPVFERASYFSPVLASAASATSLLRVVASDEEDFGVNADVEYAVSGGNGSEIFAVDKITGWMTAVTALSGRKGSWYEVRVSASDRGVPPQTVEVTVILVVTDDNQHTPTFSALRYQVIVAEDEAVGTAIISVSASDSDNGFNGQVTYSITSGGEDSRFVIDPRTGAVRISAPLDFETTQEYQLNVTAEDAGFRRLSSTARLTVAVTDINDNPPVFASPTYEADITENSAVGVSIFRLMATDEDSGRNAVIQYAIVGGDGHDAFAVDPHTGVVTALVVFDYEEKIMYELDVLATNPETELYASARLVVNVRGDNEFYPRFVQPVFRFAVSASAEPGTRIGAVLATDADQGDDGDVLYLLVGGAGQNFGVNAHTGVVTMLRKWPEQRLAMGRAPPATAERVVLTVIAKNGGPIRGNDTDETQVIIEQLWNENSVPDDGSEGSSLHAPKFERPYYEGHVKESAQLGTAVLAVRAGVTDNLNSPSRRHTYLILTGDDQGVFTVDPLTGELRVAATLDRETVSFYNLTLAAEVAGVGTVIMARETCNVRIVIDDVNDNAPYLEMSGRSGTVAENDPAGTVAAVLTTSDADIPPNSGPFKYTIVGGDNADLVVIDSNEGILRTRRPIDRELTKALRVIVEVTDSGQPPKSSRATVNIRILDRNDNPSTSRNLSVTMYSVASKEPITLSVPSVVAHVQPADPDEVNDFNCRLISPLPADFLSVKPNCGLTVSRMGELGEYSLEVAGGDGVHAEATTSVNVVFEEVSEALIRESVAVRVDNVSVQQLLTDRRLPLMMNSVARMMAPMAPTIRPVAMAFLQSANYKQDPESGSPQYTDFFLGLRTLDAEPVSKRELLGKLTASRADEVLTQILVENGLAKASVHVGFHPCDTSPCLNGGSCSSTIQVLPSEVLLAESSTMSIASMTVRHVVTCRCRPRFQGSLCQVAQPSGPSDGSRPNLVPPHQTLEYRAKSFGEHSFAAFSLPRTASSVTDVSIAIMFATSSSKGLLVYRYGAAARGRSDFLSLEIVNSRVRFSFGAAGSTATRIIVDSPVSDARWYRVTAARTGKIASLQVVQCEDNGVTCQQCNAGDSKCWAEKLAPPGTLHFGEEPIYVGGVRSASAIMERAGQVGSDDFVGCILGASINGEIVDFNKAVASHNILSGCPNEKVTCPDGSCGDGGTCIPRGSRKVCACADGIIAPDCSEAFEAVTLQDGAFVEFRVTEKFRRRRLRNALMLGSASSGRNKRVTTTTRTLGGNLSLKFRTTAAEGILMYFATEDNFTALYFHDGVLLYASRTGLLTSVNLTVSETSVSDGLWHQVTIEKQESDVLVSLDAEGARRVKSSLVHDFLDPFLTTVSVGGVVPDTLFSNTLLPTLEGCISTLLLDGELQSLSSNSTAVQIVDASMLPFPRGHVKRGCVDPVHVGNSSTTDPLNVGVALVIVFFVVLIMAILVSFIVYRRRRQQRDKGMGANSHGALKQTPGVTQGTGNGNIDSHVDSGFVEGMVGVGGVDGLVGEDALRSHFAHELAATKKFKEREVIDRGPGPPSQRPDIIEPEALGLGPKKPHAPAPPCRTAIEDVNGDPDAPEHYDLENASSLAPSDIDIVYHYKGYRDGNVRKYRTNPHVQGYHRHAHHRHSPRSFQTSSGAVIGTGSSGPGQGPGSCQGPGSNPLSPTQGVLLVDKHGARAPPPVQQSPKPAPPPPLIRDSPGLLKMQSTPLARLSPSSELSQQMPRILTLEDISGKPLQRALLAATPAGVKSFKDQMTNSERSLNSPISHLSHSTGSANSNHQAVKKKSDAAMGNIGLTAEDIDRLNTRPRTSSLVSTLHAVSSSSSSRSDDDGAGGNDDDDDDEDDDDEENTNHAHHHHHHHRSHHIHHHNGHSRLRVPSSANIPDKDKLVELMETNTELMETADSSTDESGNDSFTCSEFEYDHHGYEKAARDFRTGNMIFSKLAEESHEHEMDADSSRHYDGFDSFRGSLSTLVASDDDDGIGTAAAAAAAASAAVASHLPYKPANGSTLAWDCLLSWGPSYETMVGVFKDIGELPDTAATPNSSNVAKSNAKPGEEYV